MENLLQFQEKSHEILRKQRENYENLGNTGGVMGYFEYNSTGKLLPILKGWKLEKSGQDCPILGIHFDEQAEIDVPLYGMTEKEEVYNIGMSTIDKMGRPGKLVGLTWDKETVSKKDC